MIAFLFLILVSFLPIQVSYASMAQLEDYPFNNENQFKKRDYQIIKFFKNSPCLFDNYLIPSQNDPEKSDTFRACSIDLSPLKDKKNELIAYIQNPNKWSEKYIHPSLYKKYHSYKNRRFFIKDDLLIIYIPEDALLFEILQKTKDPCEPLNPSTLQLKKLDQNLLINKACLIRVYDPELKKDGSLKAFYNPLSINKLFNFYENKNSFKNIFLSNLDISFEPHKTILYPSRFLSEIKPSDNQSDQNNQIDQSGDGEFDIYIIEVSSNENKVIESILLYLAEKTSCSPLKESQVDASQIPQGHSLVFGCSIRIQDSRLKKNAPLASFYHPDAMNMLFYPLKKNSFKKVFLDAVNIDRINKKKKIFNLDAIIYSQNFHPSAYLSSHSSRIDSKNPIHKTRPDPNNLQNNHQDNDAFNIHIIVSQDPLYQIKELILSQALNDYCKPILNSPILKEASMQNLLFYKGCQITIPKSLSKDLNYEILKDIFNNSSFKVEFIKKINENKRHASKKPYAEYSLVYPGPLSSKDSFDIFIVQTKNKKIPFKHETISIDLLKKEIKNHAKINTCRSISENELKKVKSLKINHYYFLYKACWISLKNKIFKKDYQVIQKTHQILNESSFQKDLFATISFQNNIVFELDSSFIHSYLNSGDGLLIIIFYLSQSKKEIIKNILSQEAPNSFSLLKEDKELLKNKLKLPDNRFLTVASQFTLQDSRLSPDGDLSDFYNPETIENILKEPGFKEKLMNLLKDEDKISGDFDYSIELNQENHEIDITFYQTLSQDEAQEVIKESISQEALKSRSLLKKDKELLKNKLNLPDNRFLTVASQFTLQDSRLSPDGSLRDFYNPETIENILKEPGFKQKLMNLLKDEDKLSGDFDYSIELNHANNEIDITFYQTLSQDEAQEVIKESISQEALKSRSLLKEDKELLKNKLKLPDYRFVTMASQFTLQDSRLSPDGSLSDFYNPETIENILKEPGFKEKLMSLLKDEDKLSGDFDYSIELNQENHEIDITFYQTLSQDEAQETIKNSLSQEALKSRSLLKEDKEILKNKLKLPDNRFLTMASQFTLQDSRLSPDGYLRDFYNPETIENILKEPGFKQKLMNLLKDEDKLSGDFDYSIELNQENHEIDITFYQTLSEDEAQEVIKESISQEALKSRSLLKEDKELLKNKLKLPDYRFVTMASQFTLQDSRLSPDGYLRDFYNPETIENILKEPGFKEKLMNLLKDEDKLSGDFDYSIELNQENHEIDITFYQTLSEDEAQEVIKESISQEALKSRSLLKEDKELLKNKLKLPDYRFVTMASQFTLQDSRLSPDGYLRDFYNPETIENILKEPGFKEKLMNLLKDEDKLSGDFDYSIELNQENHEIDITFYQTLSAEEVVEAIKESISQEAPKYKPLLKKDKEMLKNKLKLYHSSSRFVGKGIKFSLQDSRLSPDGDLRDFYNPEIIENILKEPVFKEKLMSLLKDEDKIRNDFEYFIEGITEDNKTINIIFFEILDREIEKIKVMILKKAKNSQVLSYDDIYRYSREIIRISEGYISAISVIPLGDKYKKDLKMFSIPFKDSDFKTKVINILKKSNTDLTALPSNIEVKPYIDQRKNEIQVIFYQRSYY